MPDPIQDIKAQLRPFLLELIEATPYEHGLTPEQRERLKNEVRRTAERTLKQEWRALSPLQRDQLINDVVDEAIGLGPLQPLVNDKSISEIMVNGPGQIYIERRGRLEKSPIIFRDRDQLMYVVEQMLSHVGRRVSIAEPYVDARLADGARINVAISPAAIDGPYVTIRKVTIESVTLNELVRLDSLTAQAAQFLELCVQGRMNLIISGPASSGKTTMMNALAHAIPVHERIITVEETAELHFPHSHVARLEARPPSIEGTGEITLRHLVRNALHMRPDRILVGEVLGGEALDMLQAMMTGHDGSMTTLHANTPEDVLDRIETLALMSKVDVSHEGVARQVRSALDLIVHLQRFPDGSRKVTKISEVKKSRERLSEPLVELFTRETADGEPQGALRPTGARPLFAGRMAYNGVKLSEELLRPLSG